jgi:hypothetical protein
MTHAIEKKILEISEFSHSPNKGFIHGKNIKKCIIVL